VSFAAVAVRTADQGEGLSVDRRGFLTGLAVAVSAAVAGCGGTGTGTGHPAAGPGTAAITARRVFAAPSGITRAAVPRGTLSRLPGEGRLIALTIDDGTDSAVVAAYADLCRVTGLRATFFCNGVNPSWTEHAGLLRPLLESNQIFIANHTWSHPDLLRLTAAGITDQVRRNERFLTSTFGVTGRPFLRPPYGYRNARLDAQLADLGYPAVTMWLGSLGDSTVQTPARIVAAAQQWFLPQHLVIGHANHAPVTRVLDKLIEILQERHLQPVHLGDVFTT
jgi:peptidoglycan/xylan/chitin deacetylase (PgdA/CDA1 family)